MDLLHGQNQTDGVHEAWSNPNCFHKGLIVCVCWCISGIVHNKLPLVDQAVDASVNYHQMSAVLELVRCGVMPVHSFREYQRVLCYC